MHLVFAKALRLHSSTVQDVTAGQLINLMSKDASKLQEFTLFGHNLWSAPMTALWVIGGLYIVLGWPAAAGIVITIVLVPVQSKVAKMSQKFRKEYMRLADSRLKMLGRVIEGIKMIKLSAWESEVLSMLSKVRGQEVKSVRSSSLLLALNRTLMDASPIVVALSTFSIYTLAGYSLSADQAFTALALFNLLGHPFHVLPKSISLLSDLRVTLERLQAFFRLPDKPVLCIAGGPPTVQVKVLSVGWPRPRAEMRGGGEDSSSGKLPGESGVGSLREFGVSSKQAKNKEGGGAGSLVEVSLRARAQRQVKVAVGGVSFDVRGGELVVVVGGVGSGKSTLLSALVGEASTSGGTCNITGTGVGVGYLPQVPWVKNGTVRENVVMSWGWDEERFRGVVRACGLDEDLLALPDGEMTEVGERGITLSGGQRQRISLARAFYAPADVHVLDCPLASLDSRTAKQVFEEGIMGRIVSRGSACIMSSNSAWMLRRATRVVVLEGGGAVVGTPDELSSNPAMDRYFKRGGGEGGGKGEEGGGGGDSAEAEGGAGKEEGIESKSERARKAEGCSTKRVQAEAGAGGQGGGKTKGKQDKDKVKGMGRVGWKVYVDYCNAASLPLATIVCICAIGAQTLSVLKDVVLSEWSGSYNGSSSSSSNSSSSTSNIGSDARWQANGLDSVTDSSLDGDVGLLNLYAACACAAIAFQGLRSLSMSFANLAASQSLHDAMVHRVLAAPMRFFETTPVGQITNRFSTDTDGLDFSLPNAISMWMDAALTLAAAVALLASTSPAMIIVFALLSVAYRSIQAWFDGSATNLKRIEAATKSPVFTAFSQMVEGMTSVRALGLSQHLVETTSYTIDESTAAYLSWAHCNRWLGVRLDLLGGFVVLSTALLCLRLTGTDYGQAGLFLTYAITITRTIAVSIRSTTQMEMQFSAVERIKEFTEIEVEADDGGEEPGEWWPNKGAIEWDQVWCRYLDGQPEVLKGVSVQAEAGTCIGICGRTGAGKSSMLMALLRVLRCSGGQVRIDGVDVSRMSLRRLRSSVGIIPQDPVQIAANIREALDPRRERGDAELEEVLSKVGLIRGTESEHYGGGSSGGSGSGGDGVDCDDEGISLELELKEGGGNLSVGQRQLLCLARALLDDKRILLLDEATAHVDDQTADRLRECVLALRGGRTVVVIAHRLEDVAVCDQVIVMDGGVVAQKGAPLDLLADSGGKFAALAAELGKGVLERIRAVAEAAHDRKPASVN